ncbi:MAG TPA: hypothetical protein VIY48_16070 [Candidatus Paceibacterota bacterium]
MAALRNIRHERFVREYIANGGNGAEAYRRVVKQYPCKATGMNNPEGFRVVACIIRKRPEVRQREQELRDKMAKRADITMEKVLTDYQEALELAKAQAKPNEIVNAATAQAKLVGLLRDRVETGDVGSFDGMDNLSDILAKVAEEAGPDAALALSKAFGIDSAKEPAGKVDTPSESEASGLIDQMPPSDSLN